MKQTLKVIQNTIEIGLSKPVKFLHMTDTHLTRDDPTGWRDGAFDLYPGGCEELFAQAVDYAVKNKLTILHTGDLIDFFSKGNFDYIDNEWNKLDYIYAVGNHDFCHFLGEATEDYEYKWEMMKVIAPHFKHNLYFYSRMLGEVNIVTLDNSYYLMTEGQLEALKAEVAKGYPIILAMHVPIFTESIFEYYKSLPNATATHVVAAPQELLDTFPEDRRLQQTPDKATLDFIEYIKNEPLIKALITGHKHMNFFDMLSPTLPQYVTTGTHYGEVREFTVV